MSVARQVRSSERWHRGLMEHANDAIFVLDPARGVVLDLNRRAEQLVGRPLEDVVGTRLDVMKPVLEMKADGAAQSMAW